LRSLRRGRVVTASLVAFSIGLGGAAAASADPDQTVAPTPGPPPITASDGGAAEPAVTACKQFARALRVSSAYYNKFAHAIAGDGAQVNYDDPKVIGDNVDGRTALRKSAAEALIASGTPGLQPEIADPMRSWSLRATKLLMAMGLRLDGNTLNDAATELNTDANDAQMACTNAGARPVIRVPRTNPGVQPATA
jgi:hypothetical protein